MEITTTDYSYCHLVQVSGRIDSFTAPKLAEGLMNVTSSGRYQIVLDFTDVNYVSSAGLRVLIDIQKICKKQNRGQLVLSKVPIRVYETLELAGFLPLFRIFDNVDLALEHFHLNAVSPQ